MQNVSVVYEAQDVVIDQGAILEGPKKVRSRKWRQENNEILYIYILEALKFSNVEFGLMLDELTYYGLGLSVVEQANIEMN